MPETERLMTIQQANKISREVAEGMFASEDQGVEYYAEEEFFAKWLRESNKRDTREESQAD